MRFQDRGLLRSPVVNFQDQQNVITFDETGALITAPPGAGVIAVALVSSDDRTGEILDADLVFNGRDYRFSIGDPGTRRAHFVDLQATATHEIGHILGIDHTGLMGTPARRPVMNPFDNSEAPVAARVLKPDDVAAVGCLYPSAAFSGLGCISGTVKRSDGTGAFGVQVVAYDATGNFVVSGLSGYQTGQEGDGEYALIGLPPGSYTVGIEPLDRQITSAHFTGIFFRQLFDRDFSSKLYSNAPGRPQASVVRVQAGRDISDIHLSTGPVPSGPPVAQGPVVPQPRTLALSPEGKRSNVREASFHPQAGLEAGDPSRPRKRLNDSPPRHRRGQSEDLVRIRQEGQPTYPYPVEDSP